MSNFIEINSGPQGEHHTLGTCGHAISPNERIGYKNGPLLHNLLKGAKVLCADCWEKMRPYSVRCDERWKFYQPNGFPGCNMLGTIKRPGEMEEALAHNPHTDQYISVCGGAMRTLSQPWVRDALHDPAAGIPVDVFGSKFAEPIG